MTRTIFTGGQVFDGTGSQPRRADVAVEDGRFVDIGDNLKGDEVVDVTGKTLIPGMFDCHVHILGVEMAVKARLDEPFSYQFYNAKRNLELTLACGITTIRDCAGADLGVKKAIEDGLLRGPRLLISVTAISQTGGHMDGWTPSTLWVDPYYIAHPGRPSSIADGVDGVRKVARQSLRAGADFLKVLATHGGGAASPTRFSNEELKAIGDEARASRVGLAIHAYGSSAVKDSIAAGATTIEHVSDLDDDAIAAMKGGNAWLVPTLARLVRFLPGGPLAMPESDREALGHQAGGHTKTELAVQAVDSVKRAFEAGVGIAMGTDFGNDAGQNLEELVALRTAGLDPTSVLIAATLGSAKALQLDSELGSIELGKRADLVVIDGNIFDFEKLKDNIEAVYMDGCLVHRR